MANDLPPPGSVLADRYRMDAMLARGGVGVIYRGTDLQLDRPVALKLLPVALDKGSKRERFLREARLAATVNHPHVVKIYDAGFFDDDRPFLAMELLDGASLHQRIQRVGPLGVGETCSMASQLLGAAHAVHESDIVHRDMKPANVFLLRALGVTVKLIDFGMSRSMQEQTITEPGRVIGTPGYMAPEQLLGRPTDPRTDVYGVGCTMWEALTGMPYITPHKRIEKTLAAVLERKPEPPSVRRPRVPEYVDAIVLQALARDPADRFQTSLDMKRACDDALMRAEKEGW